MSSSTVVQNYDCHFTFAFCSKEYNEKELEKNILKLKEYCLKSNTDPSKTRRKRRHGLRLLSKILSRVSSRNKKHLVSLHNLNSLVWCSLICVHYFYLHIKYEHCICQYILRRQLFNKSLRTYKKLINLFINLNIKSILNLIVSYITELKIWKWEKLSETLLEPLISDLKSNEYSIQYLLLLSEEKALNNNIKDAQIILRILYGLLKNFKLVPFEIAEKFLVAFKRCVLEPSSAKQLALRCGLDICLRQIIENLSNDDLLNVTTVMIHWSFQEHISDDLLLECGNIVEYSAMLHKTHLFAHSLKGELFASILKLFESSNRLHNLLGNRILQYILDRANNRNLFDRPILFSLEENYEVKVPQCSREDRLFFERYREIFHGILMQAIIDHGHHRINLETIYTTISLLIVEIPCGFTAAAIVCLVMNIQDYTIIQGDHITLASAHRLHATAISLMTLICWVHKAEVLYDYIQSIVNRRSHIAPHLNPPLKSTYKYGQHHVLWNKREMYLENWEVRYGLWKCFRSAQSNAIFQGDFET